MHPTHTPEKQTSCTCAHNRHAKKRRKALGKQMLTLDRFVPGVQLKRAFAKHKIRKTYMHTCTHTHTHTHTPSLPPPQPPPHHRFVGELQWVLNGKKAENFHMCVDAGFCSVHSIGLVNSYGYILCYIIKKTQNLHNI